MESGTTLGHYEILSLLGKGGMGEVWRARDTKLGREVEIKTLPEEFAKDADRLARFEREARLLAALNHPNIAAIHGFEEHSGTHFLVLELVEGDTLADRLKRGAIPVEESLKLALQIAEALEAAHDKGVIHRDLKPANIKVTPDDKVKVLDFGLAKAFEGNAVDPSVSNSPTLSMAATQQGMILGTAAYMAPEQAKGRAIDKRADVWAFGCVLYEMLSGRQSFGASDFTESLAAVIRAEPEWTTLPGNLHPRLREAVERCLEKDVNKRFRDIGDVKVDIEKVLADPSGVLVQPVVEVVRAGLQSKLLWVVGLILAVISGAIGWNLIRPGPLPQTPTAVTRFFDELPEGQAFRAVAWPFIAISPDGSQLAYNTTLGLSLRSMDEFESRIIPGTEEPLTTPFFSPDGQWLGYWSSTDGLLKKIQSSGGTPITLTEASFPPQGARWGLDDTIVYGQRDGIWRVSANGGSPELVWEPDALATYSFPQILPDVQAVLFSRRGQVEVQSLDSGERTTLFVGTRPYYVPTGHLVYNLDEGLFARPFDVGRLEATGGPVPVVEGVSEYDISGNGTLVYRTSSRQLTTEGQLAFVDRSGNIDLLPDPGRYVYPRLSPDGTRIAVQVDDGDESDIFIYDISRGRLDQLTFSGGEIPLWTPDGTQITFLSDDALWNVPSDFSGEPELLSTASEEFGIAGPYSWSPDGSVLLWDGAGGAAQLTRTTDDQVEHGPLLNEPYGEGDPSFSSDGNWFSYMTNETGRLEVYVQPYPIGSGPKRRITQEGGTSVVWARNGRELFFVNDGQLWAIEIETDPTLNWEDPVSLFETPWLMSRGFVNYDVSADGQRFVVIQPIEEEPDELPASQQINIVLNWFQELKERIPVP